MMVREVGAVVEARVPVVRIEKLLRRERGERLFLGVADNGRAVLHLRVSGAQSGAEIELRREVERIRAGLSAVNSPFVPAFHGLEVRDALVVELTVEEPTGVMLSDLLLQERRLPPAQALWVWEQLLAAVEPLHQAGLYYGLCHPGRLMFDRKARLVLCEPGFLPVYRGAMPSELKHASPVFQRLFPDAEYVPPELLMGKPCCAATDIYQSAVLFYRLLTGANPFGDGLSLEVYNRVLRGGARSLSEFLEEAPAGLIALVAACLQPDAEARPAGVAEVRRRLLPLGPPRASVAERLLQHHEERYSQRFPGVLEVHAGGAAAEADDIEGPAPDPAAAAEAEKLVAMAQLARPRLRTAATKSAGRGFWFAILALAVVAALLVLPGALDNGNRTTLPEAARRADGDGLTHRTLVWEPDGSARPHPAAESLLQGIPSAVKERLELLGVRIAGPASFMPPVLPPYRLKVQSALGDLTLHFTARNRLHSVELPQPAQPSEVVRYVVLYDAEGTPRTIAALDVSANPVRQVEVVPFQP